MLTTEQREVLEWTAREMVSDAAPEAADAIRQAVLDLDNTLALVKELNHDLTNVIRSRDEALMSIGMLERENARLASRIDGLDARLTTLTSGDAMPALSHYCYYVSYRHETAAEDAAPIESWGHIEDVAMLEPPVKDVVTPTPPVKGWGHIEIVLNRPIRSFEDVRVLAGFIQRKNEFDAVAVHSWQFMEDWSGEAATYQEHIAADGTVTPAPVSLSLLT
jgi:hypothetical protein